MRFELQKLTATQVCIPIAILDQDLDEMWDRFDSGMCDLTTGNAVAIAINRTLESGSEVRVVADGTCDDFHCVFGEEVIALPPQMSVWLTRCLRGRREKPIQFSLWIPLSLVTDSWEVTFPVEAEEEPVAA